jgi:hypothetical protein
LLIWHRQIYYCCWSKHYLFVLVMTISISRDLFVFDLFAARFSKQGVFHDLHCPPCPSRTAILQAMDSDLSPPRILCCLQGFSWYVPLNILIPNYYGFCIAQTIFAVTCPIKYFIRPQIFNACFLHQLWSLILFKK